MTASNFPARGLFSVLVVPSLLLFFFPSVARSDVLLLKSGKEVTGVFISVNLVHVKFSTPDGLESDYPRDQVLGVFAKGEKPTKPPKQDVLGLGPSTSVKGVLVHYAVKDPYVIYAKAKKDPLQVKALSPKDVFRYANLFETDLVAKPAATSIVGKWKGVWLGRLRVSMTIAQDIGGNLVGTLKFENQDQGALTFDEVTVKERSVHMEMSMQDSSYDAELDANGIEMKGKWIIGESRGQDLTLKRDLVDLQLPGALSQFDRGNGFAKSSLDAIRQLQERDIWAAVSLGKRYFELQPTGSDVEKVRKQLDRLQEGLRSEIGNLFKISAASVLRAGDGDEYLTYHIYSRSQSFEELKCSVSVQAEDGTVCEASFVYYTVRQGNKHHDSVGVPDGPGKAVRYRVVLEYDGITASVKEGGPPGAADWWKKSAQRLVSWDLTDADGKLQKAPTTYFSHSLGKKGIDSVK